MYVIFSIFEFQQLMSSKLDYHEKKKKGNETYESSNPPLHLSIYLLSFYVG